MCDVFNFSWFNYFPFISFLIISKKIKLSPPLHMVVLGGVYSVVPLRWEGGDSARAIAS